LKAVFKRIPFSRKFVLIGGCILLIGGASGAAAVFIGKERLFGPSYASINGLECKTVQTVNIKKNGSLWIRKFIRTEGGDGKERVKTALRVAKAVYDKQKPDLVQVSVLDKNGPELRSDMRGRSIAAQAVYIADVKKIPEGSDAQTYSAFYYDGAANSNGEFYGLRIDIPLEDTEHLSAGLTDFTDCVDPVAEAAAGAHGTPAKGHGKASGGHGAPEAAHGEAAPAAHGETPEAEHKEAPEAGSHGEPASPEAHAPVDEEQLLTSTPEHDSVSIFSFAYLKSLIFGKGQSTAVAAEPEHEPAADAPAHEESAPAEASEHVKPQH
jgi:hypothetical protein